MDSRERAPLTPGQPGPRIELLAAGVLVIVTVLGAAALVWWQVGADGGAPRFLRDSVGSAVFLLTIAFVRLLAPTGRKIPGPTDADLDTVTHVIQGQPWTFACLALLRDKALLFDGERRAFVMYGVQGHTWVALGDPVGPADCMSGLIGRFLEECDRFGGVPVFYEVRAERLATYTDFGLTFVKLGEEARVDLATLTLAGGHWSKQRQHLRHLARAGMTFRVVDRAHTSAIMDGLERVSDEWLAAKAGGEKGFSMGSFRRDYMSRFDIAVMEQAGDIVAFANLWSGAGRFELATDLIRFRAGAPPETMEALLLHVMMWGKAHAYRWFSLGIAPLSGVEQTSAAPLWSRVGSFLYAHGEPVYHFRGLRAFKEKFHPVWEPRYLVYPGGLKLPRIVANVSALIAGGYRRVMLK